MSKPTGKAWDRSKEISSMYLSGMCIRKIEKSTGISVATITKFLKAIGICRTRSESAKIREKWNCKGANHPKWRGGKHKDGYGYILVWNPNHPYAGKDRKVFEHRMVMEQHLGRILTRNETVHHINGNRSDNRISNLQLRHKGHGNGGCYRCADCGSLNIEAVAILEKHQSLQ